MTKNFCQWRKSRYSEPNGECVEVGLALDGTVGVRDTKEEGTGPILEFTSDEWHAFLRTIRAGA